MGSDEPGQPLLLLDALRFRQISHPQAEAR